MRTWKAACVVSLLVVLVGAVGFVGIPQEDVISVGFRGDPGNLDPAATMPTNNTWFMFYNVYERLCRADKEDPNKVVGILATDWKVFEDGKVWLFNLRQGVLFHDHTPFNAEAVKYSFDRLIGIGKGPASWFLDVIDEVVVEGEYGVKFILKRPYSIFPNLLSAIDGPYIVSPTACKAHATSGDPWAQEWAKENMVGTGPYVITEWVHEQYVLLEAFVDYWGGWEGKHFTKINFKIVREPSSRKLGLLTGTLDYSEDIAFTDIPSLVVAKDVDVHANSTTQHWMVHMNNQRAPLDNLKVRQAISYAFPYMDTIQYIFQGYARQAQGGLGRGLLYHNGDVFMYETDLEKAAALLAEAGHPEGGFTLDILTITGLGFQQQIAEAFQSNLAQLGITLEIRSFPWPTIVQMNELDPQERPYLTIRYNAPDFNDPFSQTLKPIYFCDDPWNWSAYCNPYYEDVYARAATTTDPDELKAIAYELQEIVVDDAVNIYIAEGTQVAATRKDIKGYYAISFYPGFAYIYDMYRE